MMGADDYDSLGGAPAQITAPERVYKRKGWYIYRNPLDDVPPEATWVMEGMWDNEYGGGHDVIFYRTLQEALDAASGCTMTGMIRPSWIPDSNGKRARTGAEHARRAPR